MPSWTPEEYRRQVGQWIRDAIDRLSLYFLLRDDDELIVPSSSPFSLVIPSPPRCNRKYPWARREMTARLPPG